MLCMAAPVGYCKCGCGELAPLSKRNLHSRGYVKGEPLPYIKGHAPLREGSDWQVDEAGCWIWQRHVLASGYGVTATGAAHRRVYRQFKGPFPDSLQLDHLCRNRTCVNPDHLEPVTGLVNSRRGTKTRLSPKLIQMIRELASAGWPHADIAGAFGIDNSYVSAIVSRKRWADVPARA